MKCSEFQQLCMHQDSLNADSEALSRWELHMLNCTDCADYFAASSDQSLTQAESTLAQQAIMTATLTERAAIDELLVSLREIEPPPELLQGVLRQTTERHLSQPATGKNRNRWLTLLQQALQRPRIAMEASFVLTSAWVLFFGVPTGLAVGVANAEERLQTPLVNSQRKLTEWQEELSQLITGGLLNEQ